MGRKASFGNLEGFNATAWIFNMKNRFGKMDDFDERWSDKQEVEHSGSISELSDDDIDARIKALSNGQ